MATSARCQILQARTSFILVSDFYTSDNFCILPYQKELVESPPARSGEIKRRLFITPILFLLGRCQAVKLSTVKLSTVNCQLSTVNCQLSTVNCQLSTSNCQAVNCQLSTVNCQLSTSNCCLLLRFDYFDFHSRNPAAHHSQHVGCAGGQVNQPIAHIGAAVVNADDYGAAVVEISHHD